MNSVLDQHFTKVEIESIELMIAAEPRAIAQHLREQLEEVVAVETKASGVGFFKDLVLSQKAIPLPGKRSYPLRGTDAVFGENEEHCAMYVLFLEGGLVSCLESSTPFEEWVDVTEPYKLSVTPVLG